MKKTATTKIAGIDYTLTSPCICICEIQNEEFDFKNCGFYFFAQTKHQLKISHTNLYPHSLITTYTSDAERYNKLSNWVIDVLAINGKPRPVYLEDYAYAATGKVFHIGENTGHLKYKFWQYNVKYQIFAPTSIRAIPPNKICMIVLWSRQVLIFVLTLLQIPPKSVIRFPIL